MIRGLRDLGKTVVLTTHYMEEAQHLADRLAILRDGVVVGSGTPADLVGSSSTRSGTVIRFRLPDGVGADAVQAAVGMTPDRSGDEFVLRTEAAQHTLYALTSWAEQGGVELQGIEVTRPTLDDVFLELTGGSDSA